MLDRSHYPTDTLTQALDSWIKANNDLIELRSEQLKANKVADGIRRKIIELEGNYYEPYSVLKEIHDRIQVLLRES